MSLINISKFLKGPKKLIINITCNYNDRKTITDDGFVSRELYWNMKINMEN